MIVIYEPSFDPERALTDSRRSRLPISDNSQFAWREFRFLVDFWRRGDHRKAEKSGIFSPKFRIKAKISDDEFLNFASSNDGADICIINAFPTIPYRSYNVWMQGEHIHSGITSRAQQLLNACDISWDLAKIPRHDHSNLCYCNFWVGTPRFWDEYVGGILNKIAVFLEKCPTDSIAKAVMENTSYSVPTPFLPFIVERLLSTYLSLQNDLKVAAYPTHLDLAKFSLTDFELDIAYFMRPRVDAADSSRSFTPEIISTQDFLGKLTRRYHMIYFATHGHPHDVSDLISS